VPGAVTAAARNAKKLYEDGRWTEALAALQSVARGDTGDDKGNCEIAAFNAAKILYRLERYDEAAAAFRVMALRTNHVMHNETLLWLVKLAALSPPVVRASDFTRYELDGIEGFHNSEQMALYGTALYLVGRARMLQAGKHAEAIDLFNRVPADSPAFDRARACAKVASGG
jgi:tetratricopeptide (TPR) repeat protein